MQDLAIKLSMLIVFFAVMVGIGLYCRRHATDVAGFVLGSRSVGPWLTAFAYGTSYFSAVVFTSPPWSLWATPGSSAGSTALPPPGPAWGTRFSGPFWPGRCWAGGPGS